MNNKIFFLSSEIAPFSETYYVSQFTKRFCSYMHLQPDTDIRLNQPKFGYISERKYILREVIRLKDMSLDFNGEENLVNLKSAFIPDTRVQVYFTEHEKYFKPICELLYKAKNGRVYKDNDMMYAYFAKVALETLKRLHWCPDIIVCNDWQLSFVPVLLANFYKDDPFFKDIKTLFIMHSINENRVMRDLSYRSVSLDDKKLDTDNLMNAVKYADYTLALNHYSDPINKSFVKDKNINSVIRKTKSKMIDIPSDLDASKWKNIVQQIEKLIRTI